MQTQDVLLYYGASKYGEGPPALGSRSPRQSFDPGVHVGSGSLCCISCTCGCTTTRCLVSAAAEAANFSRERGSYQAVFEAP